MRLAYLCDCAGEKHVGREIHQYGAAAIGNREVIREYTGHEILGCPWQAFRNPLVREVKNAVKYLEHGNLAVAYPDPSHRFVEALGFWNQVFNRITAMQMERDRDREKSRQTGGQR